MSQNALKTFDFIIKIGFGEAKAPGAARGELTKSWIGAAAYLRHFACIQADNAHFGGQAPGSAGPEPSCLRQASPSTLP
jgi:hypothetical protein